MNKLPRYRVLAMFMASMAFAQRRGEPHKVDAFKERIHLLMRSAPSGSGFDNGTKFDLEDSKEEVLVFYTSFHHMDEHGYTGWTDHTVRVVPSLYYQFLLRINGKNENQIKDYIHDVFDQWLREEIDLHEFYK